MQDLISTGMQARDAGADDAGAARAIAAVVFEELRQMKTEEFQACFKSASIMPAKKVYQILLEINV